MNLAASLAIYRAVTAQLGAELVFPGSVTLYTGWTVSLR